MHVSVHARLPQIPVRAASEACMFNVSQTALLCLCVHASALRAIDLLSQMLGPVVSGLLMTYSSLFTAVVVLALYSLGAWLPEALLLQAALRHSPRLR